MKRVIWLILLIAFPEWLSAQDLEFYLGHYRKQGIAATYRTKRKTRFYLPKDRRGCRKQLNLEMRLKDTVLVFSNNVLVDTVLLNPSLSSYNGYSVIPEGCKRKKVTLVVIHARMYVQFRVKQKYYFISVYYSPQDGQKNPIVINYRNNGPSE